MICRLCLKDTADVINIFDEVGIELNVAAVLEKYFWFSPKCDDPISTAICSTCWIQVSGFNEFYTGVEEAHRLLTERFSISTIKTEEKRKEELCESNLAKYENPLDVEGDDEETFQFNLLLEDENEFLKTSSALNDIESENEEKYQEEEPFDSENFMDEFLNDGNNDADEDNSDNDMLKLVKDEILGKLPEVRRRSERAHVRANTAKSTSKKRNKETTEIKMEQSKETLANEKNESSRKRMKKRRGRPPKIGHENLKSAQENECVEASEADHDVNANESDGMSDSKSLPTEKINFELKMREADAKIAKHLRLNCDNCGLEQATFSQLKRHMNNTHHCKGYALCCGRKFFKRVLLLGHIEKHLNPDYYKCNECDKILADKQCLRNHILLKHQPEEEKTYTCEHCPKKFAKSYLLDQHRIIHEARTNICDLCQKGFPSANLLKSHIKVIHMNYGTMCDICAKVIRGRAAFTKHQMEHAGVTQPKVQCDTCGSWHKNKYSLQKHKKRHNEEGTVHICNLCSKVSPNRSALLSHRRYVHAAERTFECGICKKAFKKALGLKEHMTLHTGEVLYKCPHCTKTFNSNANMHSHRKKAHPKEFEDARKQRRENSSKPQKQQRRTELISKDELNTVQAVTNKPSAETRDIEDFHESSAENENSIIFSVQ